MAHAEPPRVAMRDVARLAGVSTSTVSRALASPDLVADATRDKVMAAVRRSGYRPGGDHVRSGALGLLVPDIENPFFASVCKGAHFRAQLRGYGTYVADFDEDRTAEPELMTSLARRVDALILCSPRADEQVIRDVGATVPLVLVNRRLVGYPSVIIDESSGVRQLLSHLHTLGHRHIAWADGPPASFSGAQRRHLIASTASQLDMTLTELGNFRPDYSGGIVAADQMTPGGPTALVAYCSIMALGAMGRLVARGVQVPQHVSVAGFDELALADLVTPRLTTVQVSLRALGQSAVDLATTPQKTSGGPPPDLELPSGLVIRDSTGGAYDDAPRAR